MTAKEQKIKEAWEQIDYWKYLWSTKSQQTALNFDGYVFKTALPASFDKELFELDITTMCVRPKSLSGIESNNGWTKIESEADLPKDDIIRYEGCFNSERAYYQYGNELHKETVARRWRNGAITHYRAKEQFKKPIY